MQGCLEQNTILVKSLLVDAKADLETQSSFADRKLSGKIWEFVNSFVYTFLSITQFGILE